MGVLPLEFMNQETRQTHGLTGFEIYERLIADAHAAVLLPEEELTPQSLAAVVTSLVADPQRLASLASAARGRGHPDAARTIMSKILTLVS